MTNNLQIHSVSFTIDRFEVVNLSIMPPNPTIINMSSVYGDKVTIFYPLKYPSVNWRSWQDMGAVYAQIQKIFPSAEMNHVERSGGMYQYTMLEFLKYFNKKMFPKPYYPQNKSEYMSRLAIYAQRLFFDDLLNYYTLVAMAIHFNDKAKCGFKYKECHKKASSIMKLDRCEWKKRKGKMCNKNANDTRSKKKDNKIKLVSENLHLHLLSNGKTNFTSLSLALNIPAPTLRRYVKQVASDHIMHRSDKNV